MRYLILPTLLLLAGCGSITRAEYEQANPNQPKITEYQTDEGDTRVVYEAIDPRIDFNGTYTCPHGIRVVTYRDGVIVGRYFQQHSEMVK